MSLSRFMVIAIAASVVIAGSACTPKTADETKKDAGAALDATRAGAEKAVDATKVVASQAGAAMTDGWITTKIKAKYGDETILKGSDIKVETSDHVVTLSGAVPSSTAKARAAEIARGTEGVTSVVDHLVAQ